jgi:hypothetical protein
VSEPLPVWNDGPSRTAILEFVERVTEEGGADYVPPSERSIKNECSTVFADV